MKTLNSEAEAQRKALAAAQVAFEPVETAPSYAPALLRAKVLGGWLVTTKRGATLAFLPDKAHKWLAPPPPPMPRRRKNSGA